MNRAAALLGSVAVERAIRDPDKAIEKITTTWEKPVVDRTDSMRDWVPVVSELRRQQIETFGYFNNHFAGHAPASVEMFRELYSESVR